MRTSVKKQPGERAMASGAYPNPEAIFYQQYESVRRDEVVGIMLALFLGTFGVHHFYMRRTGLGILYCLFCWTGITSILGFIECFFMPGRVREFNAIQAAAIAGMLHIPVPGWGAGMGGPAYSAPAAQSGTLQACSRCRNANPAGARFCSVCGAALSASQG
jgi:TM2 domain-containing membrane protein YozV